MVDIYSLKKIDKMENINRIQLKCEKIIVKSVLDHLDPIAIILYGGYGRNEGSWVLSELIEPRPYNDFDIALIHEQKISDIQKENIKKAIKKKVEIKWVDISQYRKQDLNNLKNSILNMAPIIIKKLLITKAFSNTFIIMK